MPKCLLPQWTNISLPAPSQKSNLSSSSIFAISLHGIFSSVGILENLVILWVVGLRVRHSVTRVWILNLAASDLLATASLPFFTLYMARGKTWTLGETFCRLYSSVFFLNMFVSGFLLAAVSADRCLMVLRPVWARNHRSIGLVERTCVLIWALAVICTVPFYIFRGIQVQDGRILCYYNYVPWLPSDPSDLEALCRYRKEALAFMKLFLAFLIPLLVIILSYAAAHSHLARRRCRPPLRFVRLVVAVVVTFVLCWAPYHFFFIVEVLAPSGNPLKKFATEALHIGATLGFLNSVLNPVLYVFSCPDLCGKIRHSLGAVMESVLTEDLVELARRRSSARSATRSAAITEVKSRSCVGILCLKTEEQERDEGEASSH